MAKERQKEGEHYIFMKIRLIIIPVLIFSIMFPRACSNLGSLLIENGAYFIPEESSIFRFQETEMSSGSGGYWNYGEDDKYYYYRNTEYLPEYYILEKGLDIDYSPRYFKLRKGQEPENFDKFDFSTWGVQIHGIYNSERDL